MKKIIILFIVLISCLSAKVFEEDQLTLTFTNIEVKQVYKCSAEYSNTKDYKDYCRLDRMKELGFIEIVSSEYKDSDYNKGVFNLTHVNTYGHLIHTGKYLDTINIPRQLDLQLVKRSVEAKYTLVMKDPNGFNNVLSKGVLTSVESDIKLSNEVVFYKYTDTYNVDQYRECIDGESWIKKYGQKSGKKCEWIKLERLKD